MSVDGPSRPSQAGQGLTPPRPGNGGPAPRIDILPPGQATPGISPELATLIGQTQLNQLKVLFDDTTQGLQSRGTPEADAPDDTRPGQGAGRTPTAGGPAMSDAAMLIQRGERRGIEGQVESPSRSADNALRAAVAAGGERALSSQTDSDARTGRSSGDSRHPLPRVAAQQAIIDLSASDGEAPAQDRRPTMPDPVARPQDRPASAPHPSLPPAVEGQAGDASRIVGPEQQSQPRAAQAQPGQPPASDPDLARLAQFFAGDGGAAHDHDSKTPPVQDGALNPALGVVVADVARTGAQQAATGQAEPRSGIRRRLWIALLVAAALTAGLLTLVLVSPAQAANFTPPAGCRLEMTVQLRSCVVAQQYRCGSDRPGDQRVMYFGKNGPTYMSRIDGQTRWMESEDMVTGLRDTLDENSPDHASLSTLLETGRDDFEFWTRSSTGERLRNLGHDALTGETVEIDGQVLDVTRFEVTTYSETGDVLIRRSGQQFVSRAQGRFYGGVERSEDWTGQVRNTNDSPVLFAGPGEDGFGKTEPEFDCEMQMVLHSNGKGAT